ncbi:reverse transcriptase family protein [Trichocoleus sp. DQ-A3]|uniref:reverse transcriptase family protein n=1 Tax=Cyanophyceae TaxID=3028117 RepID=UPI0016895D0F|nr:reverse transcriptase family protein [Coleofasciculus sp. FACHB-125]MBD1903866.1 RNA-directed DNA polymerase [Coleofasciculus sp. FACHB-125]
MPRIKQAGYELNQSPFYCLKSKKNLASLLQISQSKLNNLTRSEELYIEENRFDKKRGKIRHIEEPKPDLKRVQKRIKNLLTRIQLPNYVHAPAQGHSHIGNAKAHVGAVVVRSLDIEKYFPSTPAKSIFWFFYKQMKCSSDVAGILTKLSTFKGYLPTGSPLSPILSYFSHIDMWETIGEIVRNASCTLTLYMDDVTISGNSVSGELIWEVKKQFHHCGLRSNKKKEKYYFRKNSYEITGIIVTKEGELKVPNRQHLKTHQIRQELHCETEPKKCKKLRQRLQGLEAQIQQVKRVNYPLPE